MLFRSLLCKTCSNTHSDHQLLQIKIYLQELLNQKQTEFNKFCDTVASACDLKISLEESIKNSSDACLIEEVNLKITELTTYIEAVTKALTQFEKFGNELKKPVIEQPKRLIDEIVSVLENTKIPQILINKDLVNMDFMSFEDAKYTSKKFIESKNDELFNDIREENKKAFNEIGNIGLSEKNNKIDSVLENMDFYYIKMKEDLMENITGKFNELKGPKVLNKDEEHKNDLEAINAQLEAENNELEKKISENHAKLEQTTIELNKAMEVLKEVTEKHKNIEANLVKQQDLMNTLEELNSKKTELMITNSNLEKNNSELNIETKKFKDELKNLTIKCDNMKNEHNNCLNKINEEKNNLKSLAQEVVIQEARYKEIMGGITSFKEYKTKTDDQIVHLTESLKKIYLDKSKLHEKLKTLLIEVRNMKIVFKNFTILFHRRLNSVSKLANQSLIDLKIATLKSIKVLKTKTMPISKYRNCLLTIRTYIKNFKNELHNANILFKDKKYVLKEQ